MSRPFLGVIRRPDFVVVAPPRSNAPSSARLERGRGWQIYVFAYTPRSASTGSILAALSAG